MTVALLSASQILLMKKASDTISDQTMVSLFALLYFALMVGYIYYHKSVVLSELENVAAPVILLVGVAAVLSLLSNLVYYHLLSKHPAHIVTALISTVPIFVVIFSYLFFGESMSMKHIAGIVAVIFGVVLIS
jgi:drug/metabolite transporter (DMT)-like permease